MTRPARPVLFTLCLLGVVLVLANLTLGLSPTSRRIPLVVVVPLIGLLLVELKRDMSDRVGEGSLGADLGAGDRNPGDGDAAEVNRRGVLLWILALPALVQTLGVLLGPALFSLLYYRLKSGERWGIALTAAALTGFGLWVLFGLLVETTGGGEIPLLSLFAGR